MRTMAAMQDHGIGYYWATENLNDYYTVQFDDSFPKPLAKSPQK